MRYLGIQAQNNKPAEALRLHREAVAIAERHAQGEDDPSLFNFHETLAITMRGNGMLDSSIAMHQKVLAGRRRVFGAAHIDLTFSLFNLARDLRAADRLREAFPLFQECVAMREQLFGPDHYQVAYAVGAYARAVADSGDLAGASKLFRRAASIAERAFGPEHEDAIGFYEEVAMVEVLAGRRDAALAALTTIVDRGYQGLDKAEFASLASDRRFLSLKTRVRPGSE